MRFGLILIIGIVGCCPVQHQRPDSVYEKEIRRIEFERHEELNMSYENKRLLPQHYRMIELVLEHGYGVKEVAQAMGYSLAGTGNVMACSIFQDELARQRALRQKQNSEIAAVSVVEARDKLQSLAIKAVDKLDGLLDSKNENIQHKAVESILDRVEGVMVVENRRVETQVISTDRLQLILIGMQERGLDPRKYVKSTVVEQGQIPQTEAA